MRGLLLREGRERGGDEREEKAGEAEGKGEGKRGEGRRKEGRGLSGNVAEGAFCLKSAPAGHTIRTSYGFFSIGLILQSI